MLKKITANQKTFYAGCLKPHIKFYDNGFVSCFFPQTHLKQLVDSRLSITMQDPSPQKGKQRKDNKIHLSLDRDSECR